MRQYVCFFINRVVQFQQKLTIDVSFESSALSSQDFSSSTNLSSISVNVFIIGSSCSQTTKHIFKHSIKQTVKTNKTNNALTLIQCFYLKVIPALFSSYLLFTLLGQGTITSSIQAIQYLSHRIEINHSPTLCRHL